MSETREYIIVGQDQGSSYTLWDVAPAPTDATKCAIALEEIGVEAMDAFGEVTTMWAASARAAVDQHVAHLRERSGVDNYGLSPDSNMEAYGPLGDAAPAIEPYGSAEALAVAGATVYRLEGTSTPGVPNFNVFGVRERNRIETRDRVRAGMVNSGLTWNQSNVTVGVVALGDEPGGSSLDLAFACAVLAATGQLAASALAGLVLIGELGLDGKLRSVRDIRDLVRAAADAGAPVVLVPDANVPEAREVDGIRVLGASTLSEALNLLAGHAHHPGNCVHCNGRRGAHRPCTYRQQCPDCAADAIEPVGA
ncbi:ATP-binding protein [Streptomyces sp. NA04227]|uniref:ATP-binding protein n=1 Tax=Streptomyces sp. NA04227 TaxID=2742136 RepID=UPI001591633B|nr:ATP-binding protein [Streptomyces sp. NA04227]QKW06950.1 ATP-binding protein [Streptomyces sp. NA04227]